MDDQAGGEDGLTLDEAKALLAELQRRAVPRIKRCGCVDKGPFEDVSFSPLSGLLPYRCTPELRRLQAELGARHSFREAARLLATLLPCSPPNRASVRNRLHRVAGELRAEEARVGGTASAPVAKTDASDPGIVVAIDGARIRAAPGGRGHSASADQQSQDPASAIRTRCTKAGANPVAHLLTS